MLELARQIPQTNPISNSQNFSLEIASPGLLETLAFQPKPRQPPQFGEVEIEVRATGLNFKEVLLALGLLPAPANKSIEFGLECAGTIVAIGEGVTDFHIGDDVIAFGSSCFSRRITTPASLVAPKPLRLSWEEAATIPVAFMTAYYALIELGRLRRGESILIHAAAGGVGMAAVKIAQNIGAKIFATAGNPDKRGFLKSLGIEHVMDSRSLAFADEVIERTEGRGVNVVLNSLSGDFIPKSLSVLAPYGRFLEIGKRDIYENSNLGMRAFEKNLSFFAITLEPEVPNFSAMLHDLVQQFNDGELSPLPHRTFPIAEVTSAFDYMARAKHIGKIIVSAQEGDAANRSPELAAFEGTVEPTAGQPPAPAKNVLLQDLHDGLLPSEGVEVFKRLLGSTLPQVIISTRDLQSRLEPTASCAKALEAEDGSRSVKSRPELSQAYVAPRNELERQLGQIWQQFFGIDRVGIEDDFFELGGDSLLAIQLIPKVRQATGADLSLDRLLDTPTVAGLSQAIGSSLQESAPTATVSETVVDLNAEVVLDPIVHPGNLPVEWVAEPQSILLTGATGYIGAYLLRELLDRTVADIYCLVRSPHGGEGRARIEDNLKSYGFWKPTYDTRILPVVGDLSRERLGLDEEEFRHLTQTIDTIYHNGAWVNFLYPYSTLKAANVLGTEEILKLACQSKIKPVHFISSYVVACEARAGARVVREDEPLVYNRALEDALGYGQSKWVAERLVTLARERGLPTCIYRLGEIVGDRTASTANPNQMTWAIVKSCIQLKMAPELDAIVDFTPVDYVSRALVHLSHSEESLSKVFHLVNPHPISWRDLFDLIRALGYPLESLPPDSWRKALLDRAQNQPENALQPFLPLFAQKMPFGDSIPQFDCQNTSNGLSGTDIVCPTPDATSLEAYLSSLGLR